VGFEVDRAMESSDGALPLWLLVRPPRS